MKRLVKRPLEDNADKVSILDEEIEHAIRQFCIERDLPFYTHVYVDYMESWDGKWNGVMVCRVSTDLSRGQFKEVEPYLLEIVREIDDTAFFKRKGSGVYECELLVKEDLYEEAD